ncbi:MAG: hypothetical protein MZV64_17950 [Ignavibacteriales bacterium]|nr:hypothetical protein [Ignavibacteriales bacterium]
MKPSKRSCAVRIVSAPRAASSNSTRTPGSSATIAGANIPLWMTSPSC